MRIFCPAFLCLWCTCAALAADPVIVLRDDGYYVLKPDSMTLVKVQVVDQRSGSTPIPEPGPTPPPTGTPLAEKVAGWAKQVDDAPGRAILAQAYKLIGQQIAAGAIPSDTTSVDKALTQFLDQSLDLVGTKSKWADFRGKVAGEASTKVIAAGGTLTKEQWASFFGDVSSGLSTANAGEALPDWVLQLIQQLLPILLALLTRLFGG